MNVNNLSPSLENKPKIKDSYGQYINGKFTAPGPKYINSYDPSIGEVISKITQSTKKDIDLAVDSALKASSSWAALTPNQRSIYLFNLARRVQEYSKELAILESYESGKPIKSCRDFDVVQVYETFFYQASCANFIEELSHKSLPLGVVGAVIPWNFPLMMLAWKIAPALAAGNTIVIKPAPQTSLSALRLAEIMEELEFPPGVVNIVTGDGEAGSYLLSHPKINKIAFTGSTKIGKEVLESSYKLNIPVTLELGGKGANIVLEDASIDEAVEGVVRGIFFNQGQVCSAGSRLLLQESIELEFIAKLKARMSKIILGPTLDKNTELGPLVSALQLERVQEYLEIALKEAHEVFQSHSVPKEGYYFSPTLVKVDNMASKLSLNEIFGPFLIYSTFTSHKEAIIKANNHPYGLSAGIWSNNHALAMKIANSLEAGTVWINTYNQFSPQAPFGGFKESGMGRENGLNSVSSYRKVSHE